MSTPHLHLPNAGSPRSCAFFYVQPEIPVEDMIADTAAKPKAVDNMLIPCTLRDPVRCILQRGPSYGIIRAVFGASRLKSVIG